MSQYYYQSSLTWQMIGDVLCNINSSGFAKHSWQNFADIIRWKTNLPDGAFNKLGVFDLGHQVQVPWHRSRSSGRPGDNTFNTNCSRCEMEIASYSSVAWYLKRYILFSSSCLSWFQNNEGSSMEYGFILLTFTCALWLPEWLCHLQQAHVSTGQLQHSGEYHPSCTAMWLSYVKQ